MLENPSGLVLSCEFFLSSAEKLILFFRFCKVSKVLQIFDSMKLQKSNTGPEVEQVQDQREVKPSVGTVEDSGGLVFITCDTEGLGVSGDGLGRGVPTVRIVTLAAQASPGKSIGWEMETGNLEIGLEARQRNTGNSSRRHKPVLATDDSRGRGKNVVKINHDLQRKERNAVIRALKEQLDVSENPRKKHIRDLQRRQFTGQKKTKQRIRKNKDYTHGHMPGEGPKLRDELEKYICRGVCSIVMLYMHGERKFIDLHEAGAIYKGVLSNNIHDVVGFLPCLPFRRVFSYVERYVPMNDKRQALLSFMLYNVWQLFMKRKTREQVSREMDIITFDIMRAYGCPGSAAVWGSRNEIDSDEVGVFDRTFRGLGATCVLPSGRVCVLSNTTITEVEGKLIIIEHSLCTRCKKPKSYHTYKPFKRCERCGT